jgi:hypothetical protein
LALIGGALILSLGGYVLYRRIRPSKKIEIEPEWRGFE